MKNNFLSEQQKAALKRERYSSFVVDLRGVNNKNKVENSNNQVNKREPFSLFLKNLPSFKDNQKKDKQKKSFVNLFSQEAKQLISNSDFKNNDNLRVNLRKLQLRKRFDNFFSFKKNKKLNQSFLSEAIEETKDFFGFEEKPRRNFFSKIFVDQKKKKNWQDRIKEKQKILSTRFRLNKNRELELARKKVAWYRSLLTFVLVLIFLILPLKLLSYFQLFNISELEDRVMIKSKAAINNLITAFDSASSLNFKEADLAFSEASKNFLAAKDDLSLISDSLLFLASLSNDPKLKLAAESKNFLAAGAFSSSLGRNLILATNNLFEHQERDILISLEEFLKYGELAVRDAKELKRVIAKINPNNLPFEYRQQFIALSNQADFLSNNLENFVSAASRTKEMLGLSRDKRYLLIFQNNSELRASGGFLGSYALLDVSGAKIKNLEVPGGGSYDTEGGMTVKVKSPEPLWLVNPLWHFWDANWWPDWPTTARNLMWFYEKSGGSTVDGVISFTPTVVESLLEITGPIDLIEEYGVIIDSNNFWEVVQKIVEHDNLLLSHPEQVLDFKEEQVVIESIIPLEQDLESNAANKPKKIIGDLMVKILETLPQKLDKDSLLKMVSLFENNLAQKQVLFYFTDPILQAEFSKRNFTGEIKANDKDYLMVVNTNIAGQKSDRKMIEEIEHVSKVGPDGRIINTLNISRSHTGIKNEPLTGVRNVNWLRIYVPLGSRLIFASETIRPDEKYFEKPEAGWLELENLRLERLALTDEKSGFKIYEESGKTVFAGWVMIDPGESQQMTIVYELPFNFFVKKLDNSLIYRFNKLINPDFKESINHSLLVQKQPGSKPSKFLSRLELSSNLEASYRHPQNLNWDGGWLIETELTTDKFFSILLKN